MDLFNLGVDEHRNVLPYDGEVNYHGVLLATDKASTYFNTLMQQIAWQNDEAIIFGKRIITKRKVAWYGDEPYTYTYSKVTKSAIPWTSDLLELKQLVEQATHTTYNSCLLNLYHSGEEGMAWHSDGERDLKQNGTIASLSLGAERKFAFKHKKSGVTVNMMLAAGSLLVMKGTTQTHWLHRLPPTKKVTTPRINLTFRTIVNHLGAR